MLTEVRIPVRPNGSSAYAKVERRAGDWAVVVGRRRGLDGRRRRSPTPGSGWPRSAPNTTGIPAISEALRGSAPSEELYARAGAIAAASCRPVTDNRGAAPSTSGTWPTSSPGGRCVAVGRPACDRDEER